MALSDRTASLGSELPRSTSKVGHVVAWLLLMLLAIEAAVECRAYVRYGVTVFDEVRHQGLYVHDGATGLRLLRPNAVIQGQQQVVHTNSLGLRSPEIPVVPAPHSFRIAVIGASSVMGAAERDNDHTFPAMLEMRLRKILRDRPVDVINAGIAGYSLSEEREMLERRVVPLLPDLVLLYTGFNDFAEYCRARGQSPTGPQSYRVSVPKWWLSYELAKQNTTRWRSAPPIQSRMRDAAGISVEAYSANVEQLVATAERLGIQQVMLTNARSFRQEQSLEEQIRLSQSARYYSPCFDLAGLHTLWDRHNAVLATVARKHGVPVLALDQLVPGGDAYFVNASHFTEIGDRLVADIIANYLVEHHLLPSESAL